jgi:hypothetical protein
MNGIKFVPASSNSQSIGSSVSWNSNPIYQSPESAGISWYDQATHWEPNDENIESTGTNNNQFNEPYWSSRSESNGYSWNNSAEVEWNRTSNQTTLGANTAEAANEAPTNDSTGLSEQFRSEALSAETASEAEEGVESAVKTGESFGGPWGIAAIVAQSLGDVTTNALTAGMKNTETQDFMQNSINQGIGAQLQAGLIRENETATIDKISAVSKGLDLLGPLGAGIGYAAGSAAFQPGSPYLNTVNSFNGMTNPQDTGIVQSLNTDSASGATQMVENV